MSLSGKDLIIIARPVKKRKVCRLPKNNKFGPLGNCSSKSVVNLSIDEYEAIRLIDLESLTQKECSIQMNIARTTVQGIYSKARVKIADAIVNGKKIKIDGGHYKICSGTGPKCNLVSCKYENKEKRDSQMKIIIPVEKNDESTKINNALGRAPYFYLKDLETGEVEFIKNDAVDSPSGAGIKAAQNIINSGANVLITPRCGEKAGQVLDPTNIEIYKSEGFNLEENIELYKKEELDLLGEGK